MGHRTYQRILECQVCKKIPDDGEPLWEMGSGHWCEDCCDRDGAANEIAEFEGTYEQLESLSIRSNNQQLQGKESE